MAKEEKPKKNIVGWIVVGVLVVVFILILIFIDGENNETPHDEPASIDVDIDVIGPNEPDETESTANQAAVYCEDQGGEYLTEYMTEDGSSKCVFKVLKRDVLPLYIIGLENGGLDCDEPIVDEETGEIIPSQKVKCYEITEKDALEFWETSPQMMKQKCLDAGYTFDVLMPGGQGRCVIDLEKQIICNIEDFVAGTCPEESEEEPEE